MNGTKLSKKSLATLLVPTGSNYNIIYIYIYTHNYIILYYIYIFYHCVSSSVG